MTADERRLQDLVAEWHRAALGDVPVARVAKKLLEEAAETYVSSRGEDDAATLYECADVMIACYALADKLHPDLNVVVKRRLTELWKRLEGGESAHQRDEERGI